MSDAAAALLGSERERLVDPADWSCSEAPGPMLTSTKL